VRRILSFGSYVVEESLLLRYDAVPRGNRIPTFRRNILASSPRVSKTWKTLLTKPGLSSWQSGSDHPVTRRYKPEQWDARVQRHNVPACSTTFTALC